MLWFLLRLVWPTGPCFLVGEHVWEQPVTKVGEHCKFCTKSKIEVELNK